MDVNDNIEVLSHDIIVKRAEDRWNLKSSDEKARAGRKYQHIFDRLKLKSFDWNSEFSKLSKSQMSILIKGELIRTYDSMPNKVKSCIKNRYGLSTFSSKWFKLPSCDKKVLLNSILDGGKKG